MFKNTVFGLLFLGLLTGFGSCSPQQLVGVGLKGADMTVDAGRVWANKAAAEQALADLGMSDDPAVVAFVEKKEAVKDFLKSLGKPGTYVKKEGREVLADSLKTAFASHVNDLADKGRAAYAAVAAKIDLGAELTADQVAALREVWAGYVGLHEHMKGMAASADVYRNYVNAVMTLVTSFPVPGR